MCLFFFCGVPSCEWNDFFLSEGSCYLRRQVLASVDLIDSPGPLSACERASWRDVLGQHEIVWGKAPSISTSRTMSSRMGQFGCSTALDRYHTGHWNSSAVRRWHSTPTCMVQKLHCGHFVFSCLYQGTEWRLVSSDNQILPSALHSRAAASNTVWFSQRS